MAETEQPRKKLIIKLYKTHPEKRERPSEDHSGIEKRRKVSSSMPTCHEPNTAYLSKECELRNKKGYHAVAIWVYAENPSKPCGVDSRNSRTGSEECRLKNKRVECNKGEKKRKVQPTTVMDRSKKMQCWAMLKRLMVGRDGWAFKQPILDNSKDMTRPERLEDIESKLKKRGYSEVDEFADDVRLVFSYALQYPPRSEVHRTAKRINEGFEVSWKTLKEKWMREERERKKICKREQVCLIDSH